MFLFFNSFESLVIGGQASGFEVCVNATSGETGRCMFAMVSFGSSHIFLSVSSQFPIKVSCLCRSMFIRIVSEPEAVTLAFALKGFITARAVRCRPTLRHLSIKINGPFRSAPSCRLPTRTSHRMWPRISLECRSLWRITPSMALRLLGRLPIRWI